MNFYDYFNLYGPFVITLVCAIVITVVVIRRQRRRQERARSTASSHKRTAPQAAHTPAAGAHPVKKETAPRKPPEPVPSGMTICPKCKMRVFPKADGTCPSCQAKFR